MLYRLPVSNTVSLQSAESFIVIKWGPETQVRCIVNSTDLSNVNVDRRITKRTLHRDVTCSTSRTPGRTSAWLGEFQFLVIQIIKTNNKEPVHFQNMPTSTWFLAQVGLLSRPVWSHPRYTIVWTDRRSCINKRQKIVKCGFKTLSTNPLNVFSDTT